MILFDRQILLFLQAVHVILQMCEQAAEAHKSKGAIQLSRRSRTGSDPGQLRKSSIDAILDSGRSISVSQVSFCASLCMLLRISDLIWLT